jgi:predicted AAA+ superfamily ATPase
MLLSLIFRLESNTNLNGPSDKNCATLNNKKSNNCDTKRNIIGIFAITPAITQKMIPRILRHTIIPKLGSGKAIIIFGARQTGKTTLLKSIFESDKKVVWLNGDEPDTLSLFDNTTSTRLRAIFKGHEILVIDEAQRIENVGLKLKLITDQINELQVIATGSSSFELANKVNEPLTGRKFEYQLFPMSFEEMVDHHGLMDEIRMLPHRMIFGSYPEIVSSAGNEKELLTLLANSYLYKDILMWEQIKKPDKLIKLLRALALQVGSEVSYHELGQIVDLDNETVERYVQLLEQAFVIFRLSAFSRNLRKELKRKQKIYFYDLGIRNALISNFTQIELRNDIGALWENYLISERIKYCHYHQIWQNTYFWRTHDQQEVDYIEEREGKLFAYEFKWNPKKKAKLSKTFQSAYPEHEFQVISQENYHEFISNA